MRIIAQDIINAIANGGLYALYALGIAVIFGVMRLVNFAHGELITAGAYAAVLLGGAPLPLVICVAVLTPVVLALAIERLAFRPLRNATPATLLVASFAVSFLLQSVASLAFGSLPRAANIAPGLQRTVRIFDVSLTLLNILTIAITAVMLVGVSAFLARTTIGVQMRAAAEDFTTARLMGVRANRVIAAAFALSGLLAGTAAFLLVAQTGQASPTLGLIPLLFGLVATVIGGMGSLAGAVLGGYVLGVISTVLQVTLPAGLGEYRDAFLFGAVFFILVFRPQGMLRSAASRMRTS